MGEIRMKYGNVLADQQKFSEAMKVYDLARADMIINQQLYNKLFARNPNLMLSLLMTGRSEEAIQFISSAHDVYVKDFGEKHHWTAEITGLRGITNTRMTRLKQAISDFSESIPILLATNVSSEGDFSSKQRFEIIVEKYVDLLAQIYESRLEAELGIDSAAEAFKLVDAIRGYMVQSAMGASGARVVAEEPELSDLVRREQDTQQQIRALQSMLTETLATPEDQQDPTAIKKMTLKIKTLSKARVTLLEEIKRRFPKYSEFINPQPATPALAQAHLRPGEALISIYTSKNHTYGWALPYKGEMKFSIVMLDKNNTGKIITRLRKALDPEPKTLGDIPEFDLSLAHELYRNLLKPVEEGWNDASELIIVSPGLLGQLPFSVLPTSPVRLGKQENELFSNYRQVPWLIRKVSITRLPSVSSLITLRKLPEADPGRKVFAGFGDPFFNKEQLARAEKEKSSQKIQLAKLDKKLNVDWVILSACNTGAAYGVAAEAYSGLGRAFFYAGTRAILVSMWPVETTSAQKLINGLFEYQKNDKKLSRAKAFRNSRLDLIDDSGLKESVSGKIISSYAHPLFWAPFIIVGESGSNAN